MNNQTFINKLSARVGMNARNTQIAVNAVAAELTELLCEGNNVNVLGFGQFEVKKKAERVMTMPGSGKRMLIPPKLTVNFKPSQLLKDRWRMSTNK